MIIGQEEIDVPSCPAASHVGRTTAGAGVGSHLTYLGGGLYLAGPYKGAPLSVVSITPAVASPFDAGVVVVRVGKFPALRAHYRPRQGDANLKRLALTFPSSAFIEQGHFGTICTRVQFAGGPGHGALCPKGARYGTARVWSPLVDGPLRGPVYLRSSDNNLPDAVFALRGPPSAPFAIEVVVRIDSVRGACGQRSTRPPTPRSPARSSTCRAARRASSSTRATCA